MKLLDTKKQQRQEILLGAIYLLSRLSKYVSLSEIQDCVRHLQRQFQLGYSFSKRFNCSFELVTDLRDLVYAGSLHEYNYGNDSFLPKRCFSLTPLGDDQGRRIASQLSEDLLRHLEDTVKRMSETIIKDDAYGLDTSE